MKPWLSIRDLQDILGISQSAATELMHRLPHVTTGSRYGYRMRREVFEAWAAQQDGYQPPQLKLVKKGGSA